jgi:hypothetical protein
MSAPTRQSNINALVDLINKTAREETEVFELRAMLVSRGSEAIEFGVNTKAAGMSRIHVLNVNDTAERAALIAFLECLSSILKARGEYLDKELQKVVAL